jgi:hypothetical protein
MEEAGRVIRAVCSDLKQAVRMRAREMELARAVRESEQAGQSSSRCPDRWALPDRNGSGPWFLVESYLYKVNAKNLYPIRLSYNPYFSTRFFQPEQYFSLTTNQ